VKTFLQKRISNAITLYKAAPSILKDKIFKNLKENQSTSIPEQFELPSPCKTLRIRYLPKDMEEIIVPSTAAMALVLRYGWVTKPPTLEELKGYMNGVEPQNLPAGSEKKEEKNLKTPNPELM